MVWSASQQRYYRKNRSTEQILLQRERDKVRKQIKRANMSITEKDSENQKNSERYHKKKNQPNKENKENLLNDIEESQKIERNKDMRVKSLDVMQVFDNNTGILPVTTVEANAMDSLRRRFLIPIVTVSSTTSEMNLNKKQHKKRIESIESNEEKGSIQKLKVHQKRTSRIQPSYAEVTGIKPPEYHVKDGIRVPCEPIKIYEGVTIKDALDNLLKDIRGEA